MQISISSLSAGIARAHLEMASLERVLNEADSKLGDGDTGAMLARLMSKLVEQDLSKAADLGDAFMMLAKAAAASTGSSLGTLVATAFLAIAKRAKGGTTAPWTAVAAWHLAARDAMLVRGNASLGDKTVIDCIDGVAAALDGISNLSEVRAVAVRTANEVVAEYRTRPCRVGRARMFGDKSVGIDDPGMLAYASLCQAVAREPEVSGIPKPCA
ncbi:dihydroxyacetone kinase [Phyllobacterium trifolii]|uniref:Dihydroxyacetone kinase n=1 Tax=Phyllobacterium trifolii TaxID=300193 RepID=A0A839UII6_9HYPH|nr:dihydroxyacetone kinase subunit L [Phyllobacterium trifolii]MBB3149604.1 dihydroxyacetone kinase [Phyllobacterium trifolii]